MIKHTILALSLNEMIEWLGGRHCLTRQQIRDLVEILISAQSEAVVKEKTRRVHADHLLPVDSLSIAYDFLEEYIQTTYEYQTAADPENCMDALTILDKHLPTLPVISWFYNQLEYSDPPKLVSVRWRGDDLFMVLEYG